MQLFARIFGILRSLFFPPRSCDADPLKGDAPMDMQRALGLDANGHAVTGNRRQVIRYINLRLAAMGYTVDADESNREFLNVAHDLLANHREQARLLSGHLCAADLRIQNFLDHQFKGLSLLGPVRLPGRTFVLDRHGLGRELSLPAVRDLHQSEILSSVSGDRDGFHERHARATEP